MKITKKMLVLYTGFMMAFILLSNTITAVASSYLYKSNEVSFDKKNMNITSTNVQGAIEELYESATDYSNKQDKITGGATTITGDNLTANRALISNADGKVAVSGTTSTQLSYLNSVTSNVQTQLNGKQATITGGATTITGSNLTASRALISDGSGKVAVSGTTSTQLGYLNSVTSNVQTQLNSRIFMKRAWGTTLTVKQTGIHLICLIDMQPYLILTTGASGSTTLIILHLGTNTQYSGTGSVSISGLGTFSRDSSNNIKFTRVSGGSNVAISFWYEG